MGNGIRLRLALAGQIGDLIALLALTFAGKFHLDNELVEVRVQFDPARFAFLAMCDASTGIAIRQKNRA